MLISIYTAMPVSRCVHSYVENRRYFCVDFENAPVLFETLHFSIDFENVRVLSVARHFSIDFENAYVLFVTRFRYRFS
jgi:hypothetical protein